MKKVLFIGAALLLIVSGIFVYIIFKPPLTPGDVIIERNKDDFLKMSEEKVLSYFEKNRNDFTALTTYFEKNDTSPGNIAVFLSDENVVPFEKITDGSVKKIASRIMEEGTIRQVYSLCEAYEDMSFKVNREYGLYEQGIRYVSDTQVIENDKARSKYNYVKEYKDLGNGWFYYLYYYNEIKDADIYKKFLWSMMSENEKKLVNNDWRNAIVTLVDWDSVGFKNDNVKRSFVVSVYYNTNTGVLRPLSVYFDPSTKKVVGGEPTL